MKAKIAVSELQNMLGAMGTVYDEATLDFSPEGLYMASMDASHIALLVINYPTSAFEEYEGGQKIGVRIGDFSKLVKRCKGSVQLSTTEDSLLQIKDDGKAYKLRLIEPITAETKIPKLDFAYQVMLTSVSDLARMLDDIQAVSEYVTIERKNGITLSGRGDSGEVVLENILTYAVNKLGDSDEAKATYSLDYISKMVKAIKTDKPVVIEYSTKMPIKLSFEDGRIAFYLAPRVSD